VLRGIEAAQQAGFSNIKVNMVVQRGVNDEQIVPMARHFKTTPNILRFIEFMDVGASNGWRLDDVVPSPEIIAKIHAHFPLRALDSSYRGEVAERWHYEDGGGEIGVISSVTAPFCGDCTRARLSTEGKLFTCLFAQRGHDLRALIRDSARSDDEVSAAVSHLWSLRTDRYSIERTKQTTGLRKVEMSYIGG
jgi:GTP 3',8-cyclase